MRTVLREAGFDVRIYTLDHPPPHVHVWKAGAVVKIELISHEAIEIVGAISDRDVKRAERLVAKTRATAQTRMDEDSWQRLRSRARIVRDTRKRVREERHV